MQQLSGLDATFLYLETAQMPMHVGALHVFELPAGSKGKFVTALRKHIAARLPLTPALRRRLWWMPLNMANPAWVDAEPDLREHIVSVDLPKGSAMASLEAEVSRLHPVLLPRDRPLWKFFVFEGLAPSPDGQRRVALYTQLHHAAVDGQAAVALANAILDTTSEPRALQIRPSTRQKVYKLEMTEMLRGVIGSQAQKVAAIVRNLPATAGTLKATALTLASRGIGDGGSGNASDDGIDKSGAVATLAKGKSGNLTLAPRTAFNASVTEGRAFAVMSLPLAEMKALGKAQGATLNDIVLMLCSTALRRYLARHHALPRKSLVAAVPITLRAASDVAVGAAAGNQASMSLVSLGTHIADTEARLAHICQASKAMKSTMGGLKSILPTDFPSLGIPWLMEAATALYGKAKVADRIPQVANLVISNVPGPQVPLYMAGARMLSNYPASIVVHGLGLNITVQSYDKSMDFGLMADAAAMPDVRELAAALAVAFDDLVALTAPAETAAAGESDVAEVLRRSARRLGGSVESVGAAARSAVGKAVTTSVGGVGKVVGKAVDSALRSAMEGAVSQFAGSAPAPAPRRAPASAASTKAKAAKSDKAAKSSNTACASPGSEADAAAKSPSKGKPERQPRRAG